jgi:hypothetical protein
MHQKPLLLIASLVWHLFTFAQPKAPDTLYGFEKRGNLWSVAVMQWDHSQVVRTKSYLYFDADSGGYQQLPLPPKIDTPWIDFRKHVDDYQLSEFRTHTYYGYDGWYKDVIASLC